MNEQQKSTLDYHVMQQRGTAIIEGTQQRLDGYTNMLNKYGTKQDNSTAYQYMSEAFADDMELVRLYEGNGLFTKIIDRPAEEAVKHGLDIDYGDKDIAEYVEDRLDDLNFEEQFSTAEKWARLYGGSIIVMLVDDGRGLEEPLDWNNVRSIEELRVFERSIVQPDYTSLNQFNFKDSMNSGKKIGEPEYYNVFSIYGYFTVHRSRCLVFRNGRLPEQTTNALYRYWGTPEYVKIKRALRECITTHENGPKLLERSVQAIYKMKNLANMLSTEDGENNVLKRLQVIDMARGILNSIAIDTDGEEYDFKTSSMSGVKEIIDSTCNMLSAVTDIPQTILFGRSPAGMNSTGESDFENYYNMVEKIQKHNMKANVRTVIDLILRQGYLEGQINEVPKYKVKFAALWSMSETEQASVEQTKATTEYTKAQTAQIYMDSSVIDPSEVRKSLASEGSMEIEELLADEELDIPEDTFDLGGTPTIGETISISGIDTGTDEEDDIISIIEQIEDEDNVISIQGVEDGRTIRIITDNADGGAGSGNWGHSGTPGKRGGSAKGTGSKSHRTGTKETGFSSAAKERAKQKASGGSTSIASRTKPNLKSPKEFDKYVSENGLSTLYRGYSAKTEKQQEEYANSIKEGNSITSGEKSSAFGEGVYFADSKQEAESYMQRRQEERGEKHGRVSTAALDVGAKVGDHDELQKKKSDDIYKATTKIFDAMEQGASKEEIDKLKEDYYKLQNMNYSDYVQYEGYDAVYDPATKYTVVFNQNALVVRDDSLDEELEEDSPAAAVLVIKDGKILCASRRNNEGICGPGGKVEDGETTEEAAIREAMEEFNIVPLNLIPLGKYNSSLDSYLPSMVYFTDQFSGTPEADGDEMLDEQWLSMEELRKQSLFPPFEESLNMLGDLLRDFQQL